MKSGRRVAALAAFAMVTMVALSAAPAGAGEPFVFQSSNTANQEAGAPHVELISAEPGNMTLRFAIGSEGYGLIEYRVDGVTVDIGDNFVTGDGLHPYVCVETYEDPWLCDGPARSIEESFPADATVEVRLAITSNSAWAFDWTTFSVPVAEPSSTSQAIAPSMKKDCMKSGWRDFGFNNQGHCISFVMTSKDRRSLQPSRMGKPTYQPRNVPGSFR